MSTTVHLPAEPTENMFRAAKKFQCDHDDFDSWMEFCGRDVIGQYKAMIATAPLQPEQTPELCRECSQPAMHMGNLCFGCGKAHKASSNA